VDKVLGLGGKPPVVAEASTNGDVVADQPGETVTEEPAAEEATTS
jgi:hypothetical protein